MTEITERGFSRAQFESWCGLLSRLAADRFEQNQPTQMMTSDVAWQLTGSNPKANIRFWYCDDQLIGYAWYQAPCQLQFDMLEDYEVHLVPKVIAWAVKRRRQFDPMTMPFLGVQNMDEWRLVLENVGKHAQHHSRVLVTQAFDHQQSRTGLMLAEGFEPTEHHATHMYRKLAATANERFNDANTDTTNIVSPSDDELEAFSAAHREAWHPGSSFNPETVANLSKFAPIFDRDLMLAAKRQNDFAATSIFWCDPTSRIGNIEPFGARPKFRGQGIAKALIEGGLERLKAKGMQACRVSTAGFNQQAQRLYRSCGFVDSGVSRTFSIAID